MNFVLSKNKTKIASGVASRALYSPFRSSKVKRSLNCTGNVPFSLKISNLSQLRSRVTPIRAFISDVQPLRGNFSRVDSLIDVKDSTSASMTRDEAANVIRTPSTVKENEGLMDDSMDESLFSYFNNEYRIQPIRTPVPTIVTPCIRHRYQNSMPSDITPFRSETPKIPSRNKEKEEIKLPAVENKHRTKEARTNRSPSPQELSKKARLRQDYFSKCKHINFAYKQKIRLKS